MAITNSELKEIEIFAENLFFNAKVKKSMTFHFSYHIREERINDSRNNPLIDLDELKDILKRFKNQHLNTLYTLVHDQSYVIQCKKTDINIVFAIEEESSNGNDYHKNIAVTIMRKKDWKPKKVDIIFDTY
jgi:hypothetical protein